MGRSSCCSKEGLNKGTWSAIEDQILIDYITTHGEGKWRSLPKNSGLKRCGKSCRLRWLNYLRPDIKRGNISPEEEDLIIRLHKLLGNRWSLIAGRIPGRTDNEIKNYWNSTLAKKLRGETEKIKKNGAKSASESGNGAVKTKAVRDSGISGTEEVYRVVSGDDFLDSRAVRDFGGEDCGRREEESMDSQNLGVEFNVGELLVADVLDSEFWKLCDQFDNAAEGGGGVGECVVTTSKRNVSGQFSEEMLTEWITLDDGFC